MKLTFCRRKLEICFKCFPYNSPTSDYVFELLAVLRYYCAMKLKLCKKNTLKLGIFTSNAAIIFLQ